jgi:hypothetical protein
MIGITGIVERDWSNGRNSDLILSLFISPFGIEAIIFCPEINITPVFIPANRQIGQCVKSVKSLLSVIRVNFHHKRCRLIYICSFTRIALFYNQTVAMSTFRIKLSLFINYFVFAILLNSVGTVILLVQTYFGVNKRQASYLDPFKDLSIAVASFIVGAFISRIGYKKSMLLGLFWWRSPVLPSPP